MGTCTREQRRKLLESKSEYLAAVQREPTLHKVQLTRRHQLPRVTSRQGARSRSRGASSRSRVHLGRISAHLARRVQRSLEGEGEVDEEQRRGLLADE